jgi:hypothetical protein
MWREAMVVTMPHLTRRMVAEVVAAAVMAVGLLVVTAAMREVTALAAVPVGITIASPAALQSVVRAHPALLLLRILQPHYPLSFIHFHRRQP